MTPAQSVTEALDPILVPAGFAPGHGSDDPVAGEVICCAGHGEFAERYPHLPRADAEYGGETACVDLVIDYDDDRLTRLDLEAFSLAETLHSARLEQDAATANSLTGDQLGAALPRLAGILEHLFSPPAA